MSDEFDVYGDAETGDVADAQGDDIPSAPTTDPGSSGDGLPGVPVEGYPGLRAGVFGAGAGSLGWTRVADTGETPLPAAADGASPHGGGIDWGFIHGNEATAGRRTQLSVPADNQKRVLDRSGPTIGYGFDVGQHSPSDLRQLGLSQRVIGALTPYTQMQGSAAQAYVQAHPLTLAPSDIDAIDQAVQNKSASDLAAKFDAASQVGAFASLPAKTQTAIADLFHQYGMSDPARVTPQFWGQITDGDWRGAYANLQDFKDHYPKRRKREADLLKGDMDAGILPAKTGR